MSRPKPDYTGRDYDSGLTRVQRVAQSVHEKWTDFNRANAGNAKLKGMAFVGDVLNHNIDFWALEGLPIHAQLRRSVQAHARWVGYQIQGRTAAVVLITFSLPNGAHPEDVTIPAGTLIGLLASSDGPQFQLLVDVTILAGETSAIGAAEHSENVQDITFSTGRANQVFRLGQAPYIQNSLTAVADNGAYTEPNNLFSNLLSSLPTDRHFSVEVDDDERAVVRFGDDTNGAIPTGDITFSCKVGGGEEGNVEAGTLGVILDAITDAIGDPVEVAATNAAAATNGMDAEPLERAKSNAINQQKVRNRTLAREDFEIEAVGLTGIARCLFLTSDQTAFIREGDGVGWLVAQGAKLPSGRYAAAAPTSLQVASVEEQWRYAKPGPPGLYLRAVGTSGAYLKAIAVTATIFMGPDADPLTLGQSLYESLRDWFAVELADGSANPNVNWGYYQQNASGQPRPELAWSDIFNALRDTVGVRKIEPTAVSLNGLVDDVTLKLWEFPVLGAVSLIDGDTGNALTFTS